MTPWKFGYLRPLVPGSDSKSVVRHQRRCDKATHTGLPNTVTWHMDQVDPAVLTSLVSHVSILSPHGVVFEGMLPLQSRAAGRKRQDIDYAAGPTLQQTRI